MRTIASALLMILLLAGYALLLATQWHPAIQHPDANGYFAQATVMTETGHSYFRAESDAQYLGIHWLMMPDESTFVSRYPPGYPLLIAAVSKAFGPDAALMINPVLATLTLLAVGLVVWQLVGPGWGLLAMVLTGSNVAFTGHALTHIAHMPVAFCLTWGIFALLRWSATKKLIWAGVAGLLLGCIPTARYPDAVVAVGVLLFALWHIRQTPALWKHFAAALLGALIPILPMLVRNGLVFGKFWHTGYALTGEQTGFSWENFTDHALGYVQMLQSTGAGILLVLGVVGIAWMLAVKEQRKVGVLLAGVMLPMLLLYMAYYWAPGVSNGGGGNSVMRFLVPTIPLLAIAAAFTLASALHAAPKSAKFLVLSAVLIVQGLLVTPALMREMENDADQKAGLALTTAEIRKAVPNDAVILANSRLQQHLDFAGPWKLADASVVAQRGGWFRNRRGGDADNEREPSPMQVTKLRSRAALYPGGRNGNVEKFRADLRRWAGDAGVYVVGEPRSLMELIPETEREDFEIVARFRVPASPWAEEDARSSDGPPNNRGRNDRRGGRGIFGAFALPGDEIVIARWTGV